MFTKEQLDRYSRHIILKGVGAAGQQKLMNARVLVIGAGGLGSPLLMYLAAAGVGTLGIVDFDKVDLTNLQRQIIHTSYSLSYAKTESARQTLTALNEEVSIELFPYKLDSSNARNVVKTFDLVIDGSDNFTTRYLINDACVLEGKPLLFGAISQFEGQLSLFNVANNEGESSCYRCLFPVPPEPGSVPNCSEAGVFGALPGIVGSMMAAEAIKFIVSLGESLAGILFHFDALYFESRRVRLKPKSDCVVCGSSPSITELIDYAAFCGELSS